MDNKWLLIEIIETLIQHANFDRDDLHRISKFADQEIVERYIKS